MLLGCLNNHLNEMLRVQILLFILNIGAALVYDHVDFFEVLLDVIGVLAGDELV